MKITVANAPAKACLAGEYSDWMGGQALVASLASLTTRTEVSDISGSVHLISSASDQGFFSTHAPLSMDISINTDNPLRYVLGVMQEFENRFGFYGPLQVKIESTIPTVGGLSSSAAVCVSVAAALLSHLDINDNAGEKAVDIAFKAERDRINTGCGTQDQIIVNKGGLLLLEFAPFRDYPRTMTGTSSDIDYYVTVASPGGRTGYNDISGDLISRNGSNESRISTYRDLNKTVPSKIFNALIDRDIPTLIGLSRFSTEAIRHLVSIDNNAILEMIKIAEQSGSFYARPSGPRPSGGVMVALSEDLVTAQKIAEALRPYASFVAIDRFGKTGTQVFTSVDTDAKVGVPA
ncbi:hypothetical protein BBJ66_02990 [Rhizobium sp. RSm-3]|nr:hypothetical protein BBJ66_02990 [Rhizobium sp. RSm-3]